MKRRLIAALTGTMLAALWAAPALAMSNTRFLSPGSDPVRGTVTIRVASTPDGSLISRENISVTVTITPPSGAGSPTTVNLTARENDVHEAAWNTAALPFNGTYSLEAVARSSSLTGDRSERASASARVNNPPAAPTGVKAALKDDVPHVTWAANSEKDLVGYKVMRSVDGGALTQVFSGAGTSFTDSSAPHSKALSYRVIAVRKSPVSAAGVDSGHSAATPALTVPAPPDPGAAGAGGAPPGDPEKPTVPGTNIVTGKETPKAPARETNKSFGKAVAPIVKSAPGGTAFDETLPYTGVPPEQFESAAGGEPSPLEAQAQAEAGGAPTVTNPLKFIGGGILLLIASGLMWRTSRRLLRASSFHDGKPPVVNYPTFRINRG